MRPNWWIVLLGLGLLAGLNALAPTAEGGRRPRRAQVEDPAAPASAEVVVDAYGRTPERARAVALAKACDAVAELLRKKIGGPDWQPPSGELDPDHLIDLKVITPKGDPEPRDLNGERGVVARYRVQLTAEYVSEVHKSARAQRQVERHLLLARGLGVGVVLLLVVAGYLRLEEATRGYYTALLRLAAVAVVALAGLGVWLTCPG
jgi:hypothetical protein